MSKSTRASSRDKEPNKIHCTTKKNTRSTMCYDVVKGENSQTKNKVCCDDRKKLLDDPMSVRRCKRKSKCR